MYSVKHWIPYIELQNARGCRFELEWTSIRLGDLLRSSIKEASITHYSLIRGSKLCAQFLIANYEDITLMYLILLQRAFSCSVDDCHASYRRKDHLTRHLLQHQGKLFKCPIEDCNREFAFEGNIKRHLKKNHNDNSMIINPKQHVCQETGCGKVFKYASKLRKHEDSHVKLDSVEAFCSEQGCMKYFTNKQCLEAHIRSCHQHVTCEICGSRQLKKNIKRHMHRHEESGSSDRIECEFKGCQLSFSTKSNLQQHMKAVHQEIKPFACGFVGCGLRFAYKHVRDKHEKSGCHVYATGDFIESDEQFRSRPRGGRKRKCPTVEILIRKRVCPQSPTGSCDVFGK